jgi:hypothetical protein
MRHQRNVEKYERAAFTSQFDRRARIKSIPTVDAMKSLVGRFNPEESDFND